jgi:hypothetical protein
MLFLAPFRSANDYWMAASADIPKWKKTRNGPEKPPAPPSHICASYPVDSFRGVIRIKIKPEINMGRTPRSDRHRTQALPKTKIEPKNEIEQLREENMRELVAHLAKLTLDRIADATKPEDEPTHVQKRAGARN